ncbi:hypothetical protein D3C73_1464720 [compost metagenome]
MVDYQVLQQLIFGRGKLQDLVPVADLFASAVNPERPAADFPEQSRKLIPQPGLYPGQQFFEAERLNHIIVGADGQTFDAVIHFVFGREHDHGNFRFF